MAAHPSHTEGRAHDAGGRAPSATYPHPHCNLLLMGPATYTPRTWPGLRELFLGNLNTCAECVIPILATVTASVAPEADYTAVATEVPYPLPVATAAGRTHMPGHLCMHNM